MSTAQCEDCRLALVRVVFDPDAGEGDAWGCQLDDTFSEQTREVTCPFYVGWAQSLPPPARSCKKSKGAIDGCSTGSCGSCGGSCGSGGCGLDPLDALEVKWDPEVDVEGEAGFHEAAIEAWRTAPDRPEHDHDHEHDHDQEPAPAVSPGVQGDPQVPDGRAEEPADDGFPTEAAGHAHAHGSSCGTSCGAMKALDRMGLGSDESAPVPIPLDD